MDSQKKILKIINSTTWKPIKEQDLVEFQEYLQTQIKNFQKLVEDNKNNNKKVQIDGKIIKKIDYLAKQVGKVIQKYPDHLKTIVTLLISFFNDAKQPSILNWLLSIMSSQMKYQNSSKNQKQTKIIEQKMQETVFALPASCQQAVIALPNYTSAVVSYNKEDIGSQKNNSEYSTLYNEDEQKVVQYISNPFKTTSRKSISQFFRSTVDLIAQTLLETVVNKNNITSYSYQNVIAFLKLLDHISVSLYTYYFLSLLKQITGQIAQAFQFSFQQQDIFSVQIKQKIKKTEYEDLVYTVKGLAQRWRDHKHDFNIESWQWKMQKNMILNFLQSKISQKQLYSVRILIDRCRKVEYNSYSVLNQQQLINFIQTKRLINKIYNPQNHPEVIIKGKQVFQFVTKHIGLHTQLIDIIFELIAKSNDSIGKSLYSTIQASGHTNLQKNRQYIMKRIALVPRANLFYTETFNLIESLVLLAPIQIVSQSIEYLSEIILQHYENLKPGMKVKILNIYFQLFLMAVEEGEMNQNSEQIMICLAPYFNKDNQSFTNMTFLIVDKFIQKLKQQIPKKIGSKCKKIINKVIYLLFTNYHIHIKQSLITQNIEICSSNKELNQTRINQLQLIKQLLQISDKEMTKNLIQQKELWQLIEQNSYFGRFISYYSSQSQLYILQKLIKKQNITEKDLKNIIESYYYMDKEIKSQILMKIKNLYETTSQISIKQTLIPFIVKVQGLSPSEMISKFHQSIKQSNNNMNQLLSMLMYFKQYLHQSDKNGCGSYPAFKYLSSDYSVKLKITNMLDVLNPLTFELQQKNYKTIYDVLKRLLPIIQKSLKQIKIKIDTSEKYLFLDQLKDKLNEISPYRQISITMYESQQCEWYDQSLLISKDKQLQPQIVQILKQIFNHYAEQRNSQKRLFKPAACTIFQLATRTQHISQNDTRIHHLFNNYSENGDSLTVHQWINFYYQSALINPNIVIDNIKNLGYSEIFQNASQMLQSFNISTQNQIRKCIVENQDIYESIFGIFEMGNNQPESDLKEKLLQLNFQLLNQLPLYQEINNNIHRYFLQRQTSQTMNFSEATISSEAMKASSEAMKAQQREQTFENQTQIQKVFYMGVILKCQINKLEQEHKEKQKHQTIKKQHYNKLQRLCLNKYHKSFNYIIRINQSQINPLKLPHNLNIHILNIQSLGQLLTHSMFQSINRYNKMVKSDIQDIVPLSQQLNFGIVDKQLFSFKQQSNIQYTKINSLCSINSNILANQASILLYQLFDNHHQQQLTNHKFKTEFYSNLCHIFIYQPNSIFSKDSSLSKLSNNLVYLLSENNQNLKNWYSLQLLQQITSSNYVNNKNQQLYSISAYFKTLNQILIIQTNQMFIQKVKSISVLILQSIVQKSSYSQIFQNKFNSDKLEGILLCLKTIISSSLTIEKQHQENTKLSQLCKKIITNFLVNQHIQTYLFQIISLTTLDNSEDNLNFAYKRFSDLQLKKNSKMNTENQSECGIYNLGCICYINSIFQQLYHIQPFKNAILSTKLKQQQKQKGLRKQLQKQLQQQLGKQNDNYFNEFQKIFYQLKYSKRAFLITKDFCQSYKDYTGQIINVKQQHDADQFLNGLLDKLQNTYDNNKIQKQKTIFKELFKGVMSNVITCQNCYTNKITNQDFSVLSLQIKSMSSLQESLQKMVEPEVICDYFCSTCQKKVQSIQKYRKFDTLPKYLFIHLQRLIFDLQSFSKIKLDHPINFAEQINLENYFYKQQNCPSNYRLTGFIVHFGNSEGGHYISLIKDSNENCWKKYDDSKITKWFWKTGIHQKQNAYLLIYQKIQNQEPIIQEEKQINVLNSAIIQEINKDNVNLGKQISVLRPGFGRFLIKQLQCTISCQMQAQALDINEIGSTDFETSFLKTKIIWKYLKILDQAKNCGFSDFISLTDNQINFFATKFIQYNKSPQTAEHFLDVAVDQQIVKIIYQSGQKKIRQVFMAILFNIIMMWDGFFSFYSYLIPSQQNQTIRKLKLQIQNSLSEVGKNSNKMDQYFEFLLLLNKFNPKVRQYFKQMNLVPKLVHFIMHKDSKLSQRFPFYPMNAPSSKKVNCFNSIIQIIGIYLDQFPQMINDQLIILSLSQSNFDFYKKLYEQRYENYVKLNLILTTFCKDNFQLTNRVIDQLILSNINRFNHQDFYVVTYLDLLYCILKIPDQYQRYRIQRLLGIPVIFQDLIEDQQMMIRKKKQRLVGYWNNYLKIGDEIMFPFLQILYTNRNNITYFQMIGIVFLLQLAKQEKSIFKHIINLPSPCFVYEYYHSWVNQFIKTALRWSLQAKSLQKINVRQTLNKISVLLEEISFILEQNQCHLIQNEQMYKNKNIQLNKQIQQEDNQIIQQNCNQIQHSNTTNFVDKQSWIKRNSPYLFGQMIKKSQNKKLTFQIKNGSLNNINQNIPVVLDYTIIESILITNISSYAEAILKYDDVIQPDEQYLSEVQKKQKVNCLIKNFINSENTFKSLLQIRVCKESFLNFKNQKCILSVQSLFNEYPYQYLIELTKIKNQDFSILIPYPFKESFIIRKQNQSEIKQHNDHIQQLEQIQNIENQNIDKVIQKGLRVSLLQLKRRKVKINQHEQQIIEKQQKNKLQQNKNKIDQQFPDLEKYGQNNNQFPSINQAYGDSDANYQQHGEEFNVSKNNVSQKQQICIQCPFCGFITHQFASRCPGCNEQWGLYA